MKDVHEFSKRLEQVLTRVMNSKVIGAQDKQLIERFSNVLRAQRLSTGRVAKYVNHLKIIAETLPELTHVERGLGGATKEDIEQLSIQINESEKYMPHTKSDYVTVLKRFYQWLKVRPSNVPSKCNFRFHTRLRASFSVLLVKTLIMSRRYSLLPCMSE